MSDTHCTVCGAAFVSNGFAPGYGTRLNGDRVCYSCIGKEDKAELLNTGKLIGYLHFDSESKPYHRTGFEYLKNASFMNWPGTFRVPISQAVKRSFNNFGAPRIDFWFTFEGHKYHGVNVGDNSQIARVKRLKD